MKLSLPYFAGQCRHRRSHVCGAAQPRSAAGHGRPCRSRQDRAGRIIFGTTRDAFFSLERLAKFLREAPLDLAEALNLDGGPVASQGVALGGFHRRTCGQWELAVHHGELKLLTPLLRPRTRCWEMPIVLAVLPK